MHIEENQRQSQIVTGEGFPSCRLSSIMKIILIIFTTANDSPNLVHCILMARSDLEKRKHRNFLEKHFAAARQHSAKTLWSLFKGL